MSLRSVALLIPFVFSLVVGAWIIFEPVQGSISDDLKRAGGRESIGVKQLSTKTSQVPQDILSKITNFFQRLSEVTRNYSFTVLSLFSES